MKGNVVAKGVHKDIEESLRALLSGAAGWIFVCTDVHLAPGACSTLRPHFKSLIRPNFQIVES